jgi:hypothetical protein
LTSRRPEAKFQTFRAAERPGMISDESARNSLKTSMLGQAISNLTCQLVTSTYPKCWGGHWGLCLQKMCNYIVSGTGELPITLTRPDRSVISASNHRCIQPQKTPVSTFGLTFYRPVLERFYPLVRSTWCSGHWRPPSVRRMCVAMTFGGALIRGLATQPRPSVFKVARLSGTCVLYVLQRFLAAN